jgi:hypothetical protein
VKLFVATIIFGMVILTAVLWALFTGHSGWVLLLVLVALLGGGALAVLAKRAQTFY